MHNVDSTAVRAKATQLCNMYSNETPCSACGVTFVRHHACNVWYQVALLMTHASKPTEPDQQMQASSLRCEICGITCPDNAGDVWAPPADPWTD